MYFSETGDIMSICKTIHIAAAVAFCAPLFLAGGVGHAQPTDEGATAFVLVQPTRRIPLDSAIFEFTTRSGTEGDAFCVYDNNSGECTRCPGNTDCTGSSEPSATDCFAAPECPDPGSAQADPTRTLAIAGRGDDEGDTCVYNATQGTCSSVTILPGGGTTGVGASVPDAQACADHCDSN